MGCKNCNNKGCNSCERVVITKQGERGPQGPPGIQGPKGDPGTDGRDGVDGASYVNKINSYVAAESDIQIKDSLPDPAVYHMPPGYTGLTYTNSTGATKFFFVQVSYDRFPEFTNESNGFNWVDGAIIKTVSGVDSVVKENTDKFQLNVSLFDGVNVGDVYDLITGDPIEARFIDCDVPLNKSFFAKVTLNDGESVSLKFKTKDNATESRLVRAQIFINELDQ